MNIYRSYLQELPVYVREYTGVYHHQHISEKYFTQVVECFNAGDERVVICHSAEVYPFAKIKDEMGLEGE